MRLAIACILLWTMAGCFGSSDQHTTGSTRATAAQQTPLAQSNTDKMESDEAAFLIDALQKVQAGTALLIDVRSNKEWDEAHFAIAKHIPVDKIKEDAEAAFSEIKKEQTVFIH